MVFKFNLCRYNLVTKRWRCIKTVGEAPPPRFAHVAGVGGVGGGGAEMFVHGGAGNNGALRENGRVWRLSLQTWEWR